MASTGQQAHIAEVVRRNTMSAAIAAALLCYYGYYGLAEPVVTDLFTRSNWLFYHTLRIGGPLMGLLAVGSLSGVIEVFAVDGVVSAVIGVLFVLAGGGMLIDGGGSLNTILIMFFGLMFFGSGRRNWQAYRHLAAGGRVAREDVFVPPPSSAPCAPAVEPPVAEMTSHPASVRPTPAEPVPVEPVLPIEPVLERPPPVESAPDEPEPDTPPGGFLAAMANRPPPDEPRP